MIGNTPDAEDLIDFITELRRAGYDISTEQYITAHRLLLLLAVQDDDSPLQLQRLETLLSPVLSASREEQRTFRSHYQLWLSRKQRIQPTPDAQETRGASDPTRDASIRRAKTGKYPSTLRFGWWGWVAVIFVGIILLSLFISSPPTLSSSDTITARVLYSGDQRPVANAQVRIESSTAQTDSQGFFSVTYVSTGKPPSIFIALPQGESNCDLSVILSSGIGLAYQCTQQEAQPSNWATIYATLTSKRFWIVILGITGTILFFVIAAWLFRVARRMTLRKWRTTKKLRLDELPVKGDSEQLTRALALRQTAQEMRLPRHFAASDLDVTKTIDETLRKGMFNPAYVSRKSLPEYLVLIDRVSYVDQQAGLVDEMMRRLSSNNVYIERYFFHSDPRICQRDDPRTPFRTLKELAIQYPDHYLMVFSDGGGFFNPLSGYPHHWLDLFSAWPTRFLLSSEVQKGDYREWTLTEQGFYVLSSGKAGLTKLSTILDGSPRRFEEITAESAALPPLLRGRQNRWFSSQPPAPDIVNELRVQLKAFLGDSGYFWLSACAFYPMLYFDLTLCLGVRLIGQDDLYEKFSLLVRLPWFRRGSMPDWLRARLSFDLTPEEKKSVLDELEELLRSAASQPDGFVLPFVRKPKLNESGLVNKIWARLLIITNELWKKGLPKDLLKTEPADSKLRDYVLLSLMPGGKPSRLSLTLPEELRSILYPATDPLMVSHPVWSAVALGVALATGVQIFLYFFVQPGTIITGTFINVVWTLMNVVVFWRIVREETAPPEAATVRVFIGSDSWKDAPQTLAFVSSLKRMRDTEFSRVELFFGYETDRAKDLLKAMDRCDLYIGIFEEQYEGISLIEAYQRARERNKPTFVYIKSTQTREKNISSVRKMHLTKEFERIDELTANLTADLHDWLFEEYLKPKIQNALNQKLERTNLESLLEAIKNPEALGENMLTLLRTRGYTLPMKGATVLKVKNLTMRFGGLVAVSDLNMDVRRGEIYGLIGSNGAGKTTFLNLLTGIHVPTAGQIYFEEQRIDGKRPYEIARCGIARTFQNIRLFPGMSVLKTVMMACDIHVRQNLFDAAVRSPRFDYDEREQREFCLGLLEIFDLIDVKDEIATNLSYGRQRRLEIARALATRPKLLLLDEPASGLTSSEQKALMLLIRHIRDVFGLTILLVEHDLKFVMKVCERIQVMEIGKSIALGLPEEIKYDPQVIESYNGAY